ncbi:MAG TPA: hypothetical protein VEP73_12265, partial [Actinomycetota bacterium]|nr:hypothetical protein [Actinomycetota bacterium]
MTDRLKVDRDLGVCASSGFSAAAVACGIKQSGGPDLALVVGVPGTLAPGAGQAELSACLADA